MDSSKSLLAAVAALCVAAGAGGAYLATREPARTPASENAAADISVEQSEAVVADPVDAEVPTPASTAAPPAPARAVATTRPVQAPRPAAPRREPAQPRLASPPLTAPSLEPPRPPAEPTPLPPLPALPAFEDLVIAAESVLGLQVETSLSSERARVEDEVIARVSRDVRVGDRVAIPAGSRAVGEVTLVERGGRMRERARLGVRFTSVVLADGTRVPIATETVFREGDPPGGESAAKIGGGAIGGAIIGGILGGAKGAIIGGSAGAGAGTAAVIAGGRNPATLPAGTPVTVRITEPATVTVER